MKREEAIKIIKGLVGTLEFSASQEDALIVAIKALQGDMYCTNCGARLVPENEYLEPTPTHGRLIDADALKKKTQKCATEAWKMNLTARIETGLNQFIDWIDNAPTIQVDRPMWDTCFACPLSNCCPKIQGATNEDTQKYASEVPKGCPIDRPHGEWVQLFDNTWECTNCEQCEQFGEVIESTSDFCHNCGADMRRKQNV